MTTATIFPPLEMAWRRQEGYRAKSREIKYSRKSVFDIGYFVYRFSCPFSDVKITLFCRVICLLFCISKFLPKKEQCRRVYINKHNY